MILSNANGVNGRPPDPSGHLFSNTPTHMHYHHEVGKNYNRFSIFRDTIPYELDDMSTLRNSSSIAHFIKLNQPRCPPIVAKENISPNAQWISVTNRKTPSRKTLTTEFNESNKFRSPLLKLNTTSKMNVRNKKIIYSKFHNAYMQPKQKSTHKITSSINKKINLPDLDSHPSKMSSPTKDAEMPPATPDSNRRSKKTRHRTNSTPPSSSKKKRQSKSTSPKASSPKGSSPKQSSLKDAKDSTSTGTVSTRTRSSVTKKPDQDKYLKLHPQLEDDTIQKMSKENLLQELMKITRKRKISISTETFAKAGRALLIRRAIAFKKLSSPLLQKKIYIHDTTTDDVIMAMTSDTARPLYISSLKERGIPVDKSALDLLSELDLQARLLNYRDYLKEKQQDLEQKMIEKVMKDNSYFKNLNQKQTTPTSNQSKVPDTPSSSMPTHDTPSKDVHGRHFEGGAIPLVSQDEHLSLEDKKNVTFADDPAPDPSKDKAIMEANMSGKPNEDEVNTIQHDDDVDMSPPDPSTNASDIKNEENNDTPQDGTSSDTPHSQPRTIGSSTNPLTSKWPRFDATHVDCVSSDSTPDKNKPQKRPMKSIRSVTITMRTVWYGDYYRAGMDACAKTLIQRIREIDQGAQILPTNGNPDDIITHERDFHGDKDKKWLRNSFYLHHKDYDAIHFTLRVKTMKTYKWMSSVISQFMKSTGNTVFMDTINANKLVTIGFFANFQRGFHNKSRLREYCMKFLKEKFEIEAQLNIYPRNYYAGGGTNPEKAYLVSVEVDPQVAQTVNNALMRCTFDVYTHVTYMPFTKYDDTYNAKMKGIITHHQQVKSSLEVLRIPRFNHLHPNLEFCGEFNTIRDIILSFNTPERQFVYDVDKGNGWSTTIIYRIDADSHMDDFLLQLIPLLKKHLSSASFEKAYQYKKPLMDLLTSSRRVSSYERQHVDEIFSQFSSNQVAAPTVPEASRGKSTVWKSATPPSVLTPPSVPTQTQSTAPVPQTVVSQPTTTLSRDEIIALVKEHVSEPTPPQPTLDRDQIRSIVNDTIKSDEFALPTKADMKKAIDEKLKDSSKHHLTTAHVESLINQSASKIRTEMEQEKEILETKITEVQSTLTQELKNATNPFAKALLAVQTSNQQILGMMHGFHYPSSLPHQHFNQLAPLPVMSAPSITSQPIPAIHPPRIKVEVDGEQ